MRGPARYRIRKSRLANILDEADENIIGHAMLFEDPVFRRRGYPRKHSCNAFFSALGPKKWSSY